LTTTVWKMENTIGVQMILSPIREPLVRGVPEEGTMDLILNLIIILTTVIPGWSTALLTSAMLLTPN
jgi:hypothetical protein